MIDADGVRAGIGWADAVAALREALIGGLHPGSQPARSSVATAAGELLLMPAEHGGMVGVKVLSVAPRNDALGLPRIQASYILMNAETLSPRAVLDGAALTTLRTPALSAVAVDALATPDSHRLVVFGAGPQAEGHIHALRVVRPIEQVRIVSRSPGAVTALLERLDEDGIVASAGTPDDVVSADLVVAATSAAAPVFDGGLVRGHAVVVAVGSHHPGRRELDAALLGRAVVVVDDVETALREAGDVILAIEDGPLRADDLVGLSGLISSAQVPVRRSPAVFKSVGMGWQDLVIADAVFRASSPLD
jgi:ornithine cyclodeaminase